MVPAASFLVAAALAASVAATPVIIDQPLVRTSFVKSINKGNLKGLVGRDQARARALIQSRAGGLNERAVVSFPVTNEAVSYIANVGVGSPATTYGLIIDTGSSNTWVGAGTAYVRTSTSVSTGARVAVSYGSGSFSGNEFTDRVSLASGLVITKQSIGAATTSTGFDGVDGILGIGPVDLTTGTTSTGGTIPTVTDNLFKAGTITSNLVSVSFEPTTQDTVTNGELTFGGTDSSKFTGSLVFAPITRTAPASEFWGIAQTVTYSTGTSILASTVGIVDTGTTLVLLATNALTKYRSATGAVVDANTGLLKVTATQFAALKPLNFVIAGTTFALTANAQLWPRSLNVDIGGVAGTTYLIVNDLGSNSGQGLDFINGQTFLERFYSVFDTANKRVGFATTSFTNATTN